MSSEVLKIFGPLLILLFYFAFAVRNSRVRINGSLFYVTCFVAMSSNFSLFYREMFQFVQVIFIVYFLLVVVSRRHVHSINKVLISLLILILFSVLFSGLDGDSRSQTINFLSIIGILNFLLLQLNTPERVGCFIEYIGKVSFVVSLFGIFEYVILGASRIEVTFSNPNYLSFFLGIGFCILAAGKRSSFYWLRLSVVLLAIVISGSRAGLVFPLFTFFWSTYKSSGIRSALVQFFFAVVIGGVVLLSGITRFSDDESTSGSDAERFIFLLISVEMANDHPFTGVGWGRFPAEFSDYATVTDLVYTSRGDAVDVSGQERRVTHNDLARVLAELGYVGLLFFLLMSLRLGLDAFRISKNDYVFVFPVWVGVYVFSLTHNNLNSLFFWFFFFLPAILKGFVDSARHGPSMITSSSDSK